MFIKHLFVCFLVKDDVNIVVACMKKSLVSCSIIGMNLLKEALLILRYPSADHGVYHVEDNYFRLTIEYINK